jgi:UDP-glucuronate 4-epimerase
VSEQFKIPLTIIRICSTYGPEGGTPCDRLEMMLQKKPIRLYPDKPNNYNPIYEDDYVELGIRAMEVASIPAITVNWAGSETVSVEDYCAYMGELVGVQPLFDYTTEAHTPLWPDVTYMHKVLGRTKTPWREGFRRMIEARRPDLLKRGK